jgi:hypothetical protein
MLLLWFGVLCLTLTFAGCTTPYKPHVVVHGSAPFVGIAGLIEQDSSKQVDVLLVHGMCTHTRADAKRAIDDLLAVLDRNLLPETAKSSALPPEVDGVEIEHRWARVGQGAVRFTALIWSPLTAPLKEQLAYDNTGVASDCAAAGACKPQRASINGALKDGLLNDCLSDAMIYQGASRPVIRQKLANAIAQVLEASQAQARDDGLTPGSFALVADSLGSKMSFDALQQMLNPQASEKQRSVGAAAFDRLALVFMQANQMPILGLAEQAIAQDGGRSVQWRPGADAMLQLLRDKGTQRGMKSAEDGQSASPIPRLSLVAFTDPNDLLSYRLLPSIYAVPGIDVADVLVSNSSTYFGLLELPNKAHSAYRLNAEVTRLIACGSVGSKLCK